MSEPSGMDQGWSVPSRWGGGSSRFCSRRYSTAVSVAVPHHRTEQPFWQTVRQCRSIERGRGGFPAVRNCGPGQAQPDAGGGDRRIPRRPLRARNDHPRRMGAGPGAIARTSQAPPGPEYRIGFDKSRSLPGYAGRSAREWPITRRRPWLTRPETTCRSRNWATSA